MDLPIENGGSFHSYGTVYQRVSWVGTGACVDLPAFGEIYLEVPTVSDGRVVAFVGGIVCRHGMAWVELLTSLKYTVFERVALCTNIYIYV